MHSSSFRSVHESQSFPYHHRSSVQYEHQTRRNEPHRPHGAHRTQALHALKSGEILDIGRLYSNMRELGDASRHMSRNPAGSWTDITQGLSRSSSAAQANHNLNSKNSGLTSTCKPFMGNPSVANCLAAAGEFHQTGPLEIKPTDGPIIKIVWNCATVIDL